MLTDEMKAAGWIEHDGCGHPLPLTAKPGLLRHSGHITPPGLVAIKETNGLDWFRNESCTSPDTDIIAYKPETPHD